MNAFNESNVECAPHFLVSGTNFSTLPLMQ